jgi:hypothetical protein
MVKFFYVRQHTLEMAVEEQQEGACARRAPRQPSAICD